MRITFKSLWTAPLLALILLLARSAYSGLRAHVLSNGVAPSTLRLWWVVLACFYLLIVLVWSAIVVGIFRARLDTHSLIASVANIFATGLLLGFSAITADPLVLPALSAVGLSGLHAWLFDIGGFWSFLSMYVLFNDVDRYLHLGKWA
jgi:hypothetical protein